jgi:tRNA-dihydrouridine synthase A
LLQQVDGVMVGREAYQNPYLLAEVDRRFYGCGQELPTREAVLELLLPYIQQQLQTEVRLNSVMRHILGLYHGMPGGKLWRRYLSENVNRQNVDTKLLCQSPTVLMAQHLSD